MLEVCLLVCLSELLGWCGVRGIAARGLTHIFEIQALERIGGGDRDRG